MLMKPGPETSTVGADVVEVGAGEHLGGDVAGRAAEPAGQRQRAVGLEVGVLRPAYDRVHRLAGDRLEGGRQPVAEIVLK